MPRTARVVIPGQPHHVVQRGNRRMTTFFNDGDYAMYRTLLAANCRAAKVEVIAYCLMPNHVHLILSPATIDGLRRAIAPSHTKYAANINRRQGWRGHLWQARFNSMPLDEEHFVAAVRYVELNPVRAKLVGWAGDWPWSSTRARLSGMGDELVDRDLPDPLRIVGPWEAFVADGVADGDSHRLRDR